jgi:cellulose biosynthesis protein BcsQ
MLISIWNLKGGTGKTSLSYSLVNDLDGYYITNDTYNSVISNIYSKVIEELNEKVISDNMVVFDGGGFFDDTIKQVLQHSQKIIIPLEPDLNSLNSLTNFLEELQKINNNIIFVINKVENNKTSIKDFETTKNFLIEEYKINQKNIFKLSNSRIFKNIFEEEKGIKELVNSSKINKYRYKKIYEEYKKILENVIN